MTLSPSSTPERVRPSLGRVRRISFLLATCVGFVVILAVAGELWFRSRASGERPWRIADYQRRPTKESFTDPARSFHPGLSWVRTGESPYFKRGRMNSWGYPDGEFGPKAGRFRIALVGDSVTFGSGVHDKKDLFGSLVEEMLNAAARTPGSFEVVNLGTEGYSMLQVYSALRHVAIPFLDPDMVLYAFSPNDFVDMGVEAYEQGQKYPGNCFEQEIFDLRPARRYFARERARFWLKSESALFEELRYRFALFRYQVILPVVAELRASTAPPWAQRLGARLEDRFPSLRPFTRACSDENFGYVIFEHLVDLCRSKGLPLAILSTPTFEFLDQPDDPTFQAFFDWFFEAHPPVPLYDPVADMRAGLAARGLSGHAICVSDHDCHPNVLGHRLIAEGLFRFLAQQPEIRDRLREPS